MPCWGRGDRLGSVTPDPGSCPAKRPRPLSGDAGGALGSALLLEVLLTTARTLGLSSA